MKLRRLIRLFFLSTLTSAWLLMTAPVLAQPVNTDAERLFETGFEQFQNNVFANAIDSFNELRRTYPDHPRSMDAMYYTAEAQLALGRDEEAIRILDAFDASWPTHPFAFGTRLALGKFYFDRGEWSRASNVLESVLERSPGPESSALALYWMAESRIRMNEPDAAIRTFQRIVDEFPGTPTAPRAAYAIAVAQVNMARYDQAAGSFEDLASRWPNSDYARNVGLALAEVYYELDDFGRTADEIRRQLPYLDGVARDRARFLLAESLNQLRQHDDAIVEYRYFTEGDPGNPYYRRALYGLAWNYHHQESWQWAADTFRLVHESGADDLSAESMYYEAVNRRMAREDAEAVRIFESYVTNWPDHSMVDHGWHELGVLQYQRRNWAEARDALSVFVSGFPESDVRGDALMHLGNAHIALGEFDPALQAFDRAIALDAAPVSLREDIRFQKAWLLYRNRNYREASEQFLALFESNSVSVQAAEALFWAAESYFQVDNFRRAETLFERYLNSYPGGRHVDAAHYALGWTYFRQGRYTEAIPEFQRFLNAYQETSETVPYRSDARLRLADSYFALKRYAEAVRVYGQMAADGDDYALYQIGQAYSNAGDAFEAISTFRQLLTDYPDSEWQEESRYQLGYLYFLGQEYELAISTWEELIADFPRDPLAAKAQYGIGDAWFNAGETEAAVRAYQQVLTGYPGSPFTADAAAGIQFALMADGQDRRADSIVDSLATALAGTPAADQLRFRQAEAKYQSGRSGAAATDFAAFVSSDAEPVLKAEAWYYLGMIARDDARPAEAMDAFRQVLQAPATANRRAQAARELGHLELDAGNAEAALTSFQAVERAAEGNARLVAEARFGQSLALSQLGRDAEARRLLEDVVEQTGSSPDAHPALLGLARLYLDEGNTNAAVPLLNQLAAEAQDETGAEALYLLGQEYLLRNNPRQAIETLGRMAALFPGYPEWMAKSLMAQGQAFESLGEAGQALQLYNELVSTYPDATEAAAARARIAALEN
ncbi:MAG: tetratricopeptide repeat protein [Rhodothermales bacterium]